MGYMNFLHRFFRIRYHWHVMKYVDIAVCEIKGEPAYYTADRSRCILCGQVSDVLTEAAIRLLRKYPYHKVVRWINDH